MTIEGLIGEFDQEGILDRGISASDIKQQVASAFHLDISDLEGRSRKALTALARQVAMYLIRQDTYYSLERTGRELGGRTPAAVSWGYQRIAGNLKYAPSLKLRIEKIQKILNDQNGG